MDEIIVIQVCDDDGVTLDVVAVRSENAGVDGTLAMLRSRWDSLYRARKFASMVIENTSSQIDPKILELADMFPTLRFCRGEWVVA